MKKLAIYVSISFLLFSLGYWLYKIWNPPLTLVNSQDTPTMKENKLWHKAISQPGKERIFGNSPEMIHRISLEKNEIFRSGILTTDQNRYLALYDYGHHQVFLFDSWNNYAISTIGDGAGKGPREFINPTDLTFDTNGILWIADPKLARISSFYTDDKLISIFNPEKVSPFRMVARNTDLIILASSSTIGGIFFQYDYDGRFVRTFEQSTTTSIANSLLSEGNIAASQDEIYYSLRHAGIIRKYDANLNLAYSRSTIDPVEPAQVETVALPILGDAVGHRVVKDSRVAALDIAATEEHLYVLFSGTEYAAYFYLDVYDLQSGDYLLTHRLEHPASNIAILNDVVWVKDYVDSVPHLSGYRLN